MEVRVISFGWCLKFSEVVAVGGLLTIAEALAQQPTIAAGLTKSLRLDGQEVERR